MALQPFNFAFAPLGPTHPIISTRTQTEQSLTQVSTELPEMNLASFLRQDMKTPCVTWLGRAFDWLIGNTQCYEKSPLTAVRINQTCEPKIHRENISPPVCPPGMVPESISLVKNLLPSINGIPRRLLQDNMAPVQAAIDKGLLKGVNTERLNYYLATKNLRLVDGRLVGRDVAFQSTNPKRLESVLKSTNHKARKIEAITQFMQKLGRLACCTESPVTFLDIGSGDGSTGIAAAQSLEQVGNRSVHYIGIERDVALRDKIVENLDKAGFSSHRSLYFQDYKKIISELPPVSLVLASHVYPGTPGKFLSMVLDHVKNNGVAIFVHDTSDSERLKFRDKFPGLLNFSFDPTVPESIDRACKEAHLHFVTTQHDCVIEFPTLNVADWEAFRQIKQADYEKDYSPIFTQKQIHAKHLIEFVISDRLEAFSEDERNLILKEMRTFLEEHNFQFRIFSKLQAVLSPNHSKECEAQFNQLRR